MKFSQRCPLHPLWCLLTPYQTRSSCIYLEGFQRPEMIRKVVRQWVSDMLLIDAVD
ncbi:unnamed protein product [Brassica oleracea var. botrytis]